MSLVIDIAMSGGEEIQRDLREAHELLTDTRGMNQAIGEGVLEGGENSAGRYLPGVQNHIRQAAYSRHTTASRLGATPTGYLEKAADSLTVDATVESAKLVIQRNYEIFKRTLGSVEVHVRDRKWLAIPADARAFDRSPLNFPDDMLDFFVLIPDVLACWVLRDAPKKPRLDELETAAKPEKAEANEARKPSAKEPIKNLLFWGKKHVTLPEDRELLPSDANFHALIRNALERHLEVVIPTLD